MDKPVDNSTVEIERRRIGKQIADSYQNNPQTPSDDQLAIENAFALTESYSTAPHR